MQRLGSGSLARRRLLPLPKELTGVRPTGSRVRGAVFDRLQDEVRGAKVLDLFAGTGALGLEALSRGAAEVTFVESDPRVVRFLRRQLEHLGLRRGVTVVATDVAAYLTKLTEPQHFGLVLMDPPYAHADQLAQVFEKLVRGPWLAPSAVLVSEEPSASDRAEAAPWWPSALEEEAVRRYGDTRLRFFRLRPQAPGP